MQKILIVLSLFQVAESFARYTINEWTDAGWCASALDSEQWYVDCSTEDCSGYDAYSCWETCEMNEPSTHNVEFGRDDTSAWCYCQSDCLCMEDVGSSSTASYYLETLPSECCDLEQYQYTYTQCNGDELIIGEFCSYDDLSSCVSYETIPTSYFCDLNENDLYDVVVCDTSFNAAFGEASFCATDTADVDVWWYMEYGWEQKTCEARRQLSENSRQSLRNRINHAKKRQAADAAAKKQAA